MHYETMLALLILATVTAAVLALFFKNKIVRYVFGFISAAFLVITISGVRKHSADIKNKTNGFSGIYHIDTSKSIYHSSELNKIQNLKLKVTTDNRFQFEGDNIPFLHENGSWEFTMNEDGGYLECFFEKKRINAYPTYDNNMWIFNADCIKNSQPSDIIYFNKIATE